MDLFEKRLLIVSGKGGVGKSIVSAALALLASRRGKNVLLVEMDTQDRLGPILDGPPLTDRIAPVRENISGIVLDPRSVLVDFFRTHVKIKQIYDRILESRVFNYFYEAAPGLRELVCLGKVWRLVEERAWWSGRPTWDLVVFDAPATGHGLGLLNVPETASHILIGPMRSNALKIRDMFRDPQTTALNIVTLPEEMPVNEAVMLYTKARDELHVPFGNVFLNAVFPERFEPAEVAALDALARSPRALEAAGRAAFGPQGAGAGPGLITASRYAVERGELSARYRKELRARIDLPLVEIPYMFVEGFGLKQLEEVARVIDARGGARAAAAGGAR